MILTVAAYDHLAASIARTESTLDSVAPNVRRLRESFIAARRAELAAVSREELARKENDDDTRRMMDAALDSMKRQERAERRVG